MSKFRYDTSGLWFKGNTHIHSVVSDGGKTFKELAELYLSAGYDFLFRTDHWVASDTGKDIESYPLLWIDGVELDGEDLTGSYFHVVCLGRVEGIRREDGFEASLQAVRRQGALTVLAHPHWCNNSLEDCTRLSLDGVEVYNHVCRWLNGKSDGLVHWTAALDHDQNILAFSVDDAHLRPEHPGWNGGWIVVNAKECTSQTILDAIRYGNFYSSCGPEFHSISLEGDELCVKTSPVRFARLVGYRWNGIRVGSFDGDLLTEIQISIPKDWEYVYMEIEDDKGYRAWTNNLFIVEPVA